MSSLTIQTTQNVQLDLALAGLFERVVSFILDLVIFVIYYLVVNYFIEAAHIQDELISHLVNLIFISIPYLLYDFLFEVFNNGKSPGKMLMKLQVLSITGEAASLNQYLIRSLFRIIDMQGVLIIVKLITEVAGTDNPFPILFFEMATL